MSLSNIEKIPVHQLTLITLAGPQKLQEIHEATVSDPILTTLAQTELYIVIFVLSIYSVLLRLVIGSRSVVVPICTC